VRKALRSFALAVNDALAQLGFPLCIGGIMASNPAWCLTTDEWRSQFTSWLTEPTPAALLNANIFFDFRPLAGEARLAAELRSWLFARTQGNQLFLRLMVANALQTEPPLGLIRAFAVEESDGMLDLKSRGLGFVDAARVLRWPRHPETDVSACARYSRIGAEQSTSPPRSRRFTTCRCCGCALRSAAASTEPIRSN
jgi:CBS domain-containing protein